ncbi:MAG: hypothetical protein ACXQTZ_00185 [Candidatus Alkanophagales archaeon]
MSLSLEPWGALGVEVCVEGWRAWLGRRRPAEPPSRAAVRMSP